ncbi:MAG: cupin domain-containing protein [Patescibacteria group bacterium]|nr:cupin domain-containing protein [Patescibacteria group bacterium]
MKIVRKSESTKYDASNTADVWEYSVGDKSVNASVGMIKGRYPEKGRVVNEVCKELVHVLSGEVKLVLNGKEYLLQEDDQVLIEAGEKYYWEGKCELMLINVPTWYPEQHKVVE